ncbi:response regulator [Thiorhodococcus mannitoliphagus]|uniref:histidine kinase n=1 Tax=Thiorhodococcus mannitoliphagus TaxID=329406 RepID=A0A6P1DXE5_9GAMM|nr:response regulator [Thiorhodococcus mannitoliphagus]NEX20315.1 response regulator [Thiorhodococcus mannitoliphagus]
MTPATDIEPLFKLSLAIGSSMDLETMLDRVITQMRELVNGTGAAVLQFHQPETAETASAPVVCMTPQDLPRHPDYKGFWEQWHPNALDKALAERPEGAPVVTLTGDSAIHAFRLPDFGVLIFIRDADTGVLSTPLQQALAPLWQKLANAARACLLESRLQHEIEHRQLATESAQHAKSRFVTSMAQEIRTPLNGILGLTELAIDSGPSPMQHDYMELIRSSADTLLNLLNDILDLTKIDMDQMQVEQIPFNFPVMLSEMLKSFALIASNKGLGFVFDQAGDLPHQSLGDPGRIRQILGQLCDNAIKFTDQGEIRIKVQADTGGEPDRDHIHVAISDTGIGIPDAKLEEIFTAFGRGDTAVTQRFGGTGLGLSISARLVDLMGGRIWVESQEGVGSTFHMSLPLARADSPTALLTPLHHWPGKRALVVDAHPANRRAQGYWFKQWGFEVEEAANGQQALEIAQTSQSDGKPIDVYLLDAAQPEVDGFGLASLLKDAGLISQSHMILISAAGKRGDALRCREVGIGAFLTKPVTPLELRETLTHFLSANDSASDAPLLTRHHLVEHRQRLRILLVDDNPVAQKLAGSLLKEWGHEVTIATDGQKAVELYRSQCFHLVFLDLYMPGMDGIETARALRELERNGERTPIIGMTARTLESDAERCLEAGMDEHITKPLNPNILEEIVLHFATQC